MMHDFCLPARSTPWAVGPDQAGRPGAVGGPWIRSMSWAGMPSVMATILSIPAVGPASRIEVGRETRGRHEDHPCVRAPPWRPASCHGVETPPARPRRPAPPLGPASPRDECRFRRRGC